MLTKESSTGPATMVVALLALGSVLGIPEAGRADEVRGRVKRLSVVERALVVLDQDENYWLFVVAPDAAIRVRGKDAPLDQLHEFWSVQVSFTKQGAWLVANCVEASPVYFSRRSEEEEFALVRIFYATDRQSNQDLVIGWDWYVQQWRGPAIASVLTLLIAALAWHRRGKLSMSLAALGLVVTVALAMSALSTEVHLTEGAVSPNQLYGTERGKHLALGTCSVSIPREHKLGTLETPSILKFEFVYNPSKHVTLQGVTTQTSDAFYAELRQCVARSKRQEAFVFIHGYNVAFPDAARRTAQLAYDLEFDGAPILYSWPSQAAMLQYTVDESNVEWTVHHLQAFLSDLAARSGARVIHLVAHSMGNRALTRALQGLAGRPGFDPSRFQEIVLAAPDIDAETFRRDLAPAIARAGRRVTLYASSKDEALALSKFIHGYPRAGESGAAVVVVPGTDTIDVSAVDTSLVGHSYYGDNESLLSDLFTLVKKGLPPPKRSQLRQALRDGLPYWIFQPPGGPDL